MNKVFLFFLTICLSSPVLLAQKQQGPIVKDLNTSKSGQGNVKIYQDEAIQYVVALRSDSMITRSDRDLSAATEYVKVKGFRIQIFSGNNQSRSKNEALSKKAQIESAFPELEAFVTFHSPVWRLRVGNFTSREEAQVVLSEIKRRFPHFREMSIVDAVINHPAN